MEHFLIRATVIPEIVTLIQNKYKISEKDALDAFYTSATGACYTDDETGLYGQSALFVASLFDEEISENHPSSSSASSDAFLS